MPSHKSSVTIDAPSSLVWDLLIDTSTWPSWNSLVTKCELLPDPASKSETSTPSTKLTLGQRMSFTTPFGSSTEKVSDLQTPHATASGADNKEIYTLEWVQDFMPQFLLKTRRTHVLNTLPGDDGMEDCVYETSLTFEGPLAWPIWYAYSGKITAGMDDSSAKLKQEAEKREKEKAAAK